MGRGKKPTSGPSLVLERTPHRADGRNNGSKRKPRRSSVRLLGGGACLATIVIATAAVLWPSGSPLPDAAVETLAAVLKQPLPELSLGVTNEAVATLRIAAAAAASEGRHSEAAELYRDVLEARPSDMHSNEKFFASL